jgi:hypothetical protein
MYVDHVFVTSPSLSIISTVHINTIRLIGFDFFRLLGSQIPS